MAIMASAAAPEQALKGLMRGPVFTTESSYKNIGSVSEFYESGWLPNSPSIAEIQGSGYESWEHLLNNPGGGFELPVVVMSGVDDAPQQQQQQQDRELLEAIEGIRTSSATMDARQELVVAAATGANNNNAHPCSEVVASMQPPLPAAAGSEPARSPADVDPAARKRKKDREDPKQRSEKRAKSVKASCRDRSSGSENSGESGGSEPRPGRKENPPPKQQQQQVEYSKQDYIHVRARRGQATDCHSLAERVRREKMSERMKFLQDLVPGCRKVTGKAVMLDEIINYVQSLQRQVESLSMKLASVNPAHSSHWTLESLMSHKEIQFSNINNSSELRLASSNSVARQQPFGMLQQQQPPPAVVVQQQQAQAGLQLPFSFNDMAHLNSALRNNNNNTTTSLSPPVPDVTSLRSFHTNVSQFSGRDGELQSVVHMGLHQQGQLGSFAGHLHCQLPVGHMKVEF